MTYRNFRMLLLAAALASVILFAACAGGSKVAEADVAPDPEMLKAGETLFFQCIACHTTEAGQPHMQGPNLHGIFGIAAGQKDGFPYSEALSASGVVWTDETMDKWLEKPSAFIPGSMMAYIGMPDAEDRAALIAYLEAATAPQ